MWGQIIKPFIHLGNHSRKYLVILLIGFLIAGLWPFNFTEKNNAVISPAGGLEIARHGTVYTAFPADKLKDLKRFAIHIDLVTSSDGLNAFEKIFCYAVNQEEMNFLLGQWKDGFIPVLRTEQKLQGIKFGVKEALKKDERTQFLINYDGRRLFLYQDGISKNYREVGPLSFSNWNRTYPLVVGTDAGGRTQWKGVLHEVAIYDRALSPKEISAVVSDQWPVVSDAAERQEEKGVRHPASGFGKNKEETASRPMIHYVFRPENTYETEFRGGKALGVRDLGKGEPADLVMPEQFTPYKRDYLQWEDNWYDYKSNWQDVAVNIVGFIPFGALLLLVLGKWELGIGRRGFRHRASGFGTKEENPPVSPFFKGGDQNEIAAGPNTPPHPAPLPPGAREILEKGADRPLAMTPREIILAVGLAVLGGFVVSFAIEYLQAYLPSRDSSMRDLVTNTLGTLIGALAAVWYSRKRATATSA